MPLDSSQPVQGVAGSQEVVSLSTTIRKPSLFPSRYLPLCLSICRKYPLGYPSVNISVSILGNGRISIVALTRLAH